MIVSRVMNVKVTVLKVVLPTDIFLSIMQTEKVKSQEHVNCTSTVSVCTFYKVYCLVRYVPQTLTF